MPETDYDKLSDDELESALGQAVFGKDPVIPGLDSEPESVSDEPEQETSPEVPPETADEVEASTEGEEESHPPESKEQTGPEPDVTDNDIFEQELKAIRARADHWEKVAGRHAGELGFLKQQLRRTRESSPVPYAPETTDTEEGFEGHTERQAPRAPQAQQVQANDNVTSWAIQQAMKNTYQAFVGRHQDVTEQDVQTDIAKYLHAVNFDAEPLLTANDPAYVQQVLDGALEEAYRYVSAQREEKRLAELRTRRAEQTTKRTEAKKKASVSASGSAPTPAPTPKQKPKTLSEMTDEELEKAMSRETEGKIW